MKIWLYGFGTVIILFQLVSIPAIIFRKNDLADVLWGPTFPIAALSALIFSKISFSTLDIRKIVVIALITVWAIRLFYHVGKRNLLHLRSEDIRYQNWRRQWGSSWVWRSYFQVFVLQALILCILITPVLFIISSPIHPLGILSIVGIAFWTIGFLFETVADEQLRKFKADPTRQGKFITTGLWSLSRHPNYFGEVLLWWGIWLIALESPGAWWTVVGPLGISFLILKVSGIPMLENLMQSRPGYQEYKNSVSTFFPWPQRKSNTTDPL